MLDATGATANRSGRPARGPVASSAQHGCEKVAGARRAARRGGRPLYAHLQTSAESAAGAGLRCHTRTTGALSGQRSPSALFRRHTQLTAALRGRRAWIGVAVGRNRAGQPPDHADRWWCGRIVPRWVAIDICRPRWGCGWTAEGARCGAAERRDRPAGSGRPCDMHAARNAPNPAPFDTQGGRTCRHMTKSRRHPRSSTRH